MTFLIWTIVGMIVSYLCLMIAARYYAEENVGGRTYEEEMASFWTQLDFSEGILWLFCGILFPIVIIATIVYVVKCIMKKKYKNKKDKTEIEI